MTIGRSIGTALGILVLGTAFGCDGDEPRHFPENRLYVREIFETPEECEAAQPPGFFFNCTQTAEFDADGTVVLMLTDILSEGSYRIEDDRVRLDFGATGEVERFDFEISEDGAVLIDDFGYQWERQNED